MNWDTLFTGILIGLGIGGFIGMWIEHNTHTGKNWRGKYKGTNG